MLRFAWTCYFLVLVGQVSILHLFLSRSEVDAIELFPLEHGFFGLSLTAFVLAFVWCRLQFIRIRFCIASGMTRGEAVLWKLELLMLVFSLLLFFFGEFKNSILISCLIPVMDVILRCLGDDGIHGASGLYFLTGIFFLMGSVLPIIVWMIYPSTPWIASIFLPVLTVVSAFIHLLNTKPTRE